MAKSDKVDFKLGVRLSGKFKDGVLQQRNRGDILSVNRPVAEKWVRMGLGKIVGDSQPANIKT
jgi:hypothetical protein